MIKLDFFKNEMAKLDEQFGANKFSQRKRDLIYLAIKNLEQNQLTKIVDEIIGNSKFTPTLDDFRERARQYDQRAAGVDCPRCSGGGLLSLYLKKTGQCFAVICDCKNGSKYNRNVFMHWSQINQNDFTRLAPRRLGVENPYEGVGDDFKKYQRRFHVQK